MTAAMSMKTPDMALPLLPLTKIRTNPHTVHCGLKLNHHPTGSC